MERRSIPNRSMASRGSNIPNRSMASQGNSIPNRSMGNLAISRSLC